MLASLLLDGRIRATCVRWLSDSVDENGVPSDAIWLVQRVDGVEKGVRHYMRLALSDGLAEAMHRETGIFSVQEPLTPADLSAITLVPRLPRGRQRIDVIRLKAKDDELRREGEKRPPSDALALPLHGILTLERRRGGNK